MKITKKHRKIFYVPGMISLVVLPLLCFNFFRKNKSLVQYQGVNLYVASSITGIKSDSLSYNPREGYLPKRNYFVYEMDGNKDVQKLSRANSRILSLMKSKDSINGVTINFGKKATYATFVDVLDQLTAIGVPNYVVFGNSIFVYLIPEKKKYNEVKAPLNILKCGFGEANKAYFAQLESERQHHIFIQNIKRFWMVPIAFLGLVLLNVFVFFKRNRT